MNSITYPFQEKKLAFGFVIFPKLSFVVESIISVVGLFEFQNHDGIVILFAIFFINFKIQLKPLKFLLNLLIFYQFLALIA